MENVMTIAKPPGSMATPGTGNRARVMRYRARHRRIDYVPSPEVLAIIDLWLKAKLNHCMVGVIDELVIAGHNAIAGNAQEAQP